MSLVDEQEKYYKTQNFMLTPVRMIAELVEAALFFGKVVFLSIAVGLGYPLIVYMNHEPVTFATWMVPILTLTAIATFIYTPWYVVLGGITLLLGWAAWIIEHDAPTRNQTLWVWVAFFAFGILQKYVRRNVCFSRRGQNPSPPTLRVEVLPPELTVAQLKSRQRWLKRSSLRLSHTSDNTFGRMRP